MLISRRRVIASALVMPFTSLVSRPVAAEAMRDAAQLTDVPAVRPVYAKNGLALSGYDPVTYFDEGRPREGQAEHQLKWRGATWQFVSLTNCERFEMDPHAFAPSYGGYCAYTVANHMPMKADPTAWTIYEGRLYMNFNESLRILWRRDIPGFIAAADLYWAATQKV